MPEDIIDGETGEPLEETAAPDAPEWAGRELEVITLTADVVFHVPLADAGHSITAKKIDVVDLQKWR